MPCVMDDSSSFYPFRCLRVSEIGGFAGKVGVVCVCLIVV